MGNDLRVYDSIPVDALVPTIWNDFQKEGYLHEILVPDNPFLESKKGKVFRLDPKNDQRFDMPVSARDRAKEIYVNQDFVEYETKSYRYSYFVDPDLIGRMANPSMARLRERQLGVKIATRANKLKMEADCANTFMNPSNFTQVITGVSWSNLVTADPISDLNAQAYQIGLDRGRQITDVVFGARAWSRFCSNANIKKNVSIMINNKVNPDIAKDLLITGDMLGLQRIHVGRHSFNNSNPGQAESRGFVWSQDLVWIGCLDSNPEGQALSSAVAGKYDKFGGSMGEQFVQIREFTEPYQDKDSLMIEGKSEYDFVVLDSKLGRILST